MRGSTEGNGDGSEVAGLALFPRLHVTETNKAGPRGPPRNKMALYEQLTTPSQRFKPTPVPLPSSGRAMNASMTTPVYQPQVQAQASSFDSRYSYLPMNYTTPVIPMMSYMPMMHMGVHGTGSGGGGGASATSSVNASSMRSTVLDATTESQRVPRSGEADYRRQDDDFAVPTYSATQASSQTRASGSPFQVHQELRGSRGAQKRKEFAMQKRSCVGLDEVGRMRKERSTEDDASWTPASMECLTISVVDEDVNTEETKNREADGGRRDCDGSEAELDVSQNGQERMKEQKGKGLYDHSYTTSSASTRPEVVNSVRVNMSEQDTFSWQSLENQSLEMSESSRPTRGSSAETDSSMLESMESGSICFRDMMFAFGQQEFWKAQSTIIRQQKLFARQVFELHRVIEVQQLLAKKSTLSLNIEGVFFEEEADNVPIPASPVADVPVVPEFPEGGLEADSNQSSDENSRPVPEAACQPIYPRSVPTQQDFNSESAWQAPSFGANPWAASPFMYVPYSGPCQPWYGVYPSMGAPMPLYGGSEVMRGARFPAWQQPGMSQPWGIQESIAAAAAAGWYGQQSMVPTVGGAASMGLVGGPCNFGRPTSFVVNEAVQGSNPLVGSGRQSGESGDAGANRLSKVDGVRNCGWVKGWGSPKERMVRKETETSQSEECVAWPSVAHELDRPERETEKEDGGCGAGQQSQNGNEGVDREVRRGMALASGQERVELESERTWSSGASYEGLLQSRALKRPRMEGPDLEVSPWFQVLSPSKRIPQQNGVIKVLPQPVSATPESAASILLSIQKERQRCAGSV